MTFKSFSGKSRGQPRDQRRLIISKKGYGKGWPEQRKLALERDEYTCQKCGRVGRKKGRSWDVHVHHKRKIAYFVDIETGEVDYEAANALENLEVLCAYGCHKYYDGHSNKSGFVQLK